MEKPMQSKFHNADSDELLEALESALDSIASAMGDLKGIRDYAPWFDALGELYDEMKPEYDMYDNLADIEYQNENAALTRDYYRSVI